MGTQLPSPKGAQAPNFRPMSVVAKMAGRQVGLDTSHIVLDKDAAPPSPKGGKAPPQFLAHVYSGQTAGRIKMPRGMEVGIGLGDILLDGNPAPPRKKGHNLQFFGPCLLWPNDRPYQLLLSSCNLLLMYLELPMKVHDPN